MIFSRKSAHYLLALCSGLATVFRVHATYMSIPALSCAWNDKLDETSLKIQICAGATGAPAGFEMEWMSLDDFHANGDAFYAYDDPRLCKAVFADTDTTDFALAANECREFRIGEGFDPAAQTNCGDCKLRCDTEYVIRSYVLGGILQSASLEARLGRSRHEYGNSDYCNYIKCHTHSCPTPAPTPCPKPPTLPPVPVYFFCPRTQGYWKTHGPETCAKGRNTNVWNVNSLYLGRKEYDASKLCELFNLPVKGNGLISLAHQLIAAKLNIANGANGWSIRDVIEQADDRIGMNDIFKESMPPSETSSLTEALADFNESGDSGRCQE